MFGVLGSVVIGIGKSLLTESFIKWAIFQLAESLAAKSKSKEDDKWVAEIKKQVYGE